MTRQSRSILQPHEILSMLNRLPIFASLTNEEALSVARRCQYAVYRAGSTVFREGERGDTLMILLAGRLQVSCRGEDGVNVQVAELEPGSVIGEMAVIDPAPRAASAYAPEETVVLIIDSETLDDLVDDRNPAASQIMRTILFLLARRFRTMDHRVESLFVHRLGEQAEELHPDAGPYPDPGGES